LKNLIFGDGGHAFEVSELIDFTLGKASTRLNQKEELLHLQDGDVSESNFFIGVGNPEIRVKILERWSGHFDYFPTLEHPKTYVSKSSKVSNGCILQFGVVLSSFALLGRGVLLNWNATVGHHTEIGSGTVVNPGAAISGHCNIGSGVLIGTGARILEGIAIGSSAIIGAGAVVTKNVPAGKRYIGIPAREIDLHNE
jgi:acetyltransferase EpsM